MLSFPEVAPWLWPIFAILVALILAIDLSAHRGERERSPRSALIWAGIWIGVGLGFGGVVALALGADRAEEYYAAYLIEKSLSLDNLFVFMLIFKSLKVPLEHHRKVLWWGIFGALGFRGLFIVAGAVAFERWQWVSALLGAFLVITALRVIKGKQGEPSKSRILDWFARHLPVSKELDGQRFIRRVEGRWVATPLLLALVAIEVSDVAFAVDSVPAALSVTRDRFVLYSSNALAIMGLRSLYAALATTLAKLHFMHHAMAAILGFAGLKLLGAHWIEVSPLASLAIVVGVLVIAVVASVIHGHAERRPERG